MRQVISAFFVCLMMAAPANAQNVAKINAQFQTWLNNDLWPEARGKGISEQTFKAAFKGVTPNLKLPDLIVPGEAVKVPKIQKQAEFGSPSSYFAEKIIGSVISGGKSRLGPNSKTLKSIEQKTGVPSGIVLAIWGRESGFGRAKIPYNAFEVLGTKAFMATRKELFRKEVLAALEMVETKGIKISAMRGSWAGALGQPQFMPSSYLLHAKDFDGDKTPDIWNSVPDTLGSIANYLQDKGWQKGRDWGFEVTVPPSVTCALEGPDQGKKIADWAKLGVTRVNGKPFPANELGGIGYLTFPAGRSGPAFVTTPNFFVIKEYNNSDLYALFVGHAADRIQYGGSAFAGQWGKVGGLYRSDVAAMQSGLEKLGYDVGGADGLPGFKTRRAIGDWQSKNNRQPTCFPDADLVKALR